MTPAAHRPPLTRVAPPPQPAFVDAFPHALPDALCDRLIARFEQDDGRFASRTAAGQSTNRSGVMASMEGLHWDDLMAPVEAARYKALDAYAQKYQSVMRMTAPANHRMSVPIIEKIEPGQGFGWHIDAGPRDTYDRFVSALCYLRTVEEGGHTEFPYQQLAIRPTKGLLVLFPPFWTHLHRGAPPVRGVKYNLTCFFLRTPEWQMNPR